jgi:hypothetical protein
MDFFVLKFFIVFYNACVFGSSFWPQMRLSSAGLQISYFHFLITNIIGSVNVNNKKALDFPTTNLANVRKYFKFLIIV